MLSVTLENVNVRMCDPFILKSNTHTHISSLLSCADMCHALGSKVPTVCAQVYIYLHKFEVWIKILKVSHFTKS